METIETIEKEHAQKIKSYKEFRRKVERARKLKGLQELPAYTLTQYVQVLINGASIFQLISSMECSDRIDLVEDIENEKGSDKLATDFQLFSKKYLGLTLIISGDPRGAVFKLIVDQSIGNSFVDPAHLCVPCEDCYFSF